MKMTFGEYYQFYLTLHQNIWNRRLHVVGQVATVWFVLGCLLWNPWFLFLSPLIVYPFAWSGHKFFEHNTPAAFSHPLYAKACDWIMLWDIMNGREFI